MTILYNAGELTTERVLFTRYKGTMVKMVMTSPAFWILNCLHGVCLIVDRWSESYRIPQMDWKAFHMISPLIGFFLVFYTGRSYARLTTFYEQIIGMDNTCMNWAAMVHNNLPGDADVKWNCIRLLLASMHITFYMCNDSETGGSLSDDEWTIMKGRQLITDAEIAQINAYQGYKPLLPLAWAMTEVESAVYGVPFSERPILKLHKPGGTQITDIQRYRVSDLLNNFNSLLFTFRGHCGFITNWIAMPEPFPYYHAVTFASTMYMLILTWGFTTLHYPAVLTFFSYLTMNICVMGLKEAAVAMSNPFGTDDIDFDLEELLAGAYRNAVSVLQDTRPVCGNDAEASGVTNPLTLERCSAADIADLLDLSLLTKGEGRELRDARGSVIIMPSMVRPVSKVEQALQGVLHPGVLRARSSLSSGPGSPSSPSSPLRRRSFSAISGVVDLGVSGISQVGGVGVSVLRGASSSLSEGVHAISGVDVSARASAVLGDPVGSGLGALRSSRNAMQRSANVAANTLGTAASSLGGGTSLSNSLGTAVSGVSIRRKSLSGRGGPGIGPAILPDFDHEHDPGEPRSPASPKGASSPKGSLGGRLRFSSRGW